MASRFRPPGFLALLSAAFLLALLPLLAILIHTVLGVDRIAEQSRTAVAESARATRVSRQLVEQTTSLERLARQYLVVRDEALLADYKTLRELFRGSAKELALVDLDARQRARLAWALETEGNLFDRLRQLGPQVRPEPRLAESYATLATNTRSILDINNDLTDRAIAGLNATADNVEQRLWQMLPLTIGLGIVVAVLASLILSRPIRELDTAIRRLGRGLFDTEVVVHGPSDLRQLGHRLDWLRRRLAELEAQKSHFLRHVSHELKTPLTALREGSELLADGSAGPLVPAQREIVAILREKSLQLQRLIERLLDVQRELEALSRLERTLVRLDQLVARVAAEHRLSAAAREIDLRLDLAPCQIIGDGGKLGTAIDNLISNAIKYSRAGGIIEVVLHRQDSQARLTVSDHGPGVPAADRERIFDWFYQGGQRSSAHVSSSGFGLAIAREFVLAHHGRLELVDGNVPGACFALTLPIAKPA